jgi:ABC-2 type transport system ATP-binding protein
VRAYEGEDAARHVREVLEETRGQIDAEKPLAQSASGDE